MELFGGSTMTHDPIHDFIFDATGHQFAVIKFPAPWKATP